MLGLVWAQTVQALFKNIIGFHNTIDSTVEQNPDTGMYEELVRLCAKIYSI